MFIAIVQIPMSKRPHDAAVDAAVPEIVAFLVERRRRHGEERDSPNGEVSMRSLGGDEPRTRR